MKDGVKLATDIYLPEENSVLPVLIKRTPYDKYRDMDQAEIQAYVNADYVVVSHYGQYLLKRTSYSRIYFQL